MRQVKALYKLSRPLTSLSGALAVLLGGYVAGTGEWGHILLACLTTLLVAGSANAWNDFLDVEIDRVNQPSRPLPAGLITLRQAKLFSFILAGLSLIIAAFINPPVFLIAIVTNVLLYLYSWKLKSTVLMGNATIAALSAMSAIYGGVAAGNVLPTLWLAVIIATAIMGREVLKTLADYEGDLCQRCRTVATVWGKRPTRIIFYLFLGATVIVMLLPYLLNVYRPIYAYVVGIGVFPVVVYILMRVSRYRTGPQLQKLSLLMKFDFLVWFLAVVLGAA